MYRITNLVGGLSGSQCGIVEWYDRLAVEMHLPHFRYPGRGVNGSPSLRLQLTFAEHSTKS